MLANCRRLQVYSVLNLNSFSTSFQIQIALMNFQITINSNQSVTVINSKVQNSILKKKKLLQDCLELGHCIMCVTHAGLILVDESAKSKSCPSFFAVEVINLRRKTAAKRKKTKLELSVAIFFFFFYVKYIHSNTKL